MWRPYFLVPLALCLGLTACGQDDRGVRNAAATVSTRAAEGRSPAPDVGGVRLIDAVEGGEPVIVATVPALVRGVAVRRCWIRGYEGEAGTGFRTGGILLPGPSVGTALCAVALWQAIRAAPDRDLDPGTYRLSANADGRQNQYVPDNPDWEPDDFRTVAIGLPELRRAAAQLRRTVAFP